MKKIVISVIATIVVLFFLAQTGLLAPFGIKQLSVFGRENRKSSDVDTSSEEYMDTANNLSYCFKAEGQYFSVYQNGGWKEQFMTGVNIGASEPALFPGDLTISYETYLRWFKYISEMNCNCIRVYTTMRPQFYLALNDFNKDADKPIYLFQGVWVNEDDIERLSDVYAENEKILTDFKKDVLSTVDVIHGNAVIPESPGKASGTYRTDVSRWMAGWIVGIEWDPNLVINTDEQHPNMRDYDGNYLFTQSATPFEAFLCRVGDALIDHETEQYRFQVPLAFTNWITTDPLSHPNEPHFDEDKATVNTENIKFRNFDPGMFVSYHIYPYYPDSLNYQEDYLSNKDSEGKVDTYSAYLKDLKLVHTLPMLVAEFGIPTSRGMGHESVMGYNQGHVDENAQGAMLTGMIDSIYDTGYAGGLVFTWQDEWFKRTWNNVMFDIADRRPFWSNIQTTEQCFGILAFDPGAKYTVSYPDGDLSEWDNAEATVTNDQGDLYVRSDERYVYIMVKAKDYDFNNDTLYIPINTISGQGNTKAPDDKLTFDEGADFLIKLHGASDSHIYVDRYYDAFNYHFVESRILSDFPVLKDSDKKDSGNFDEMMMCYGYNLKVGGTGVEVPDKAYETGKLQYGNGNPESEDYASLTDFCYGNGGVELRIPWQLLNVMDPSSKQQMGDFQEEQVFTPQDFNAFDFGFGYTSDDKALSISLSGSYTYDEWTIPTWHERLKPSYYELQKYLQTYRDNEKNNKKGVTK
ncbi:family 2 glycosyl transferase [Ruminococcus difficilis]|uniref:Family 2 glycosyl transferase n=1 Tax=Ruminococcus difficilis TaxID=2763069 RepID=A0A934U0Q6_9FIRM|nr:family 2 glycosyl transferase [Ruminococcus difficilis]MBK6088483.1 family 2 glycosyl transferase [Ruminococcus difficilis]